MNGVWQTPAQPVIPSSDHLDIWHCDLAPDEERLRECEQLLSPDELERAARLCFEEKRQEFVVTRACLRQVLSTAITCAPRELVFSRNAQGKPELSEEFAASGVQFNLAHSHGRAVLAVSRGATLGVDLEMLREGTDCLALASRFFSEQEMTELKTLSGEPLRRAFFACWTRKEAFVKAVGTGIAYGLNTFSVPVSPDTLAGQITCSKSGRNWHYYDLPVGQQYFAAVVSSTADTKIRYWHFS